MAGRRLDQVLAELFPDYSRSRLQLWNRNGRVQVDTEIRPDKYRVLGGEVIELDPGEIVDQGCAPEDIPLDIVFRDDDLLVVNKPAGLVVHPAAGNPDGTLQNALLHLDPVLATLPRAGIVHRLDKQTTGLLVIARSLSAHKQLVEQLQARTMGREYLAVVCGVLTAGGKVDAPVGRHPSDRKRMAVVPGGRPAVTHYRVAERFRAHSLTRLKLETGRTHQIRVHMAYIRHPVTGDPVYGGRLRIPRGASPLLMETLRKFNRQALHARRLSVVHPRTGERLEWQAPVPSDMQELVEVLRGDAESANDR